jgi:hypothetical protein
VGIPTFSIEVITLPVSNIERALRFYVDQVALRSTSTIPNDAFRIVQLTRRAQAVRSRSVTESATRPWALFAIPILLSLISRPRGAPAQTWGRCG